jgi:hypothetical protein
MYYKIVTSKSFFADLYWHFDIFDIQNGTILTAPKNSRRVPDDPKCLLNQHCFHFADGAFDTMLWHTVLCHHVKQYQIYKIEPITNVIKHRCLDSDGIYQCGASKIKFIEKQDTDELYDRAIQEYNTYHDRYDNFDININQWKQHKTTVFYLKQSYRESLPQKTYPVPLAMIKDLIRSL